jgi:hypothetical protein
MVTGYTQEARFLKLSQSDHVIKLMAFDDGIREGIDTREKPRIILEWMEKSLYDVMLWCRKVVHFIHYFPS